MTIENFWFVNLYQLRQRVNSTVPKKKTAAQNVISDITHVSNLYPKYER